MKAMLKVLLLVFVFGVSTDGIPSSVTYDERQTGDYNIRINVKDLKIVALLGEGIGALGDYDYNYDYSDLTVKPSESSSSSSTTTAASSTSQANLDLGTTTEKVVEITPAPATNIKPNATLQHTPNTTVSHKPGAVPATINQKPDPINYQKPDSANSQKLNATIIHIPASTNFIGDSVIAALQSPTIQTPIKNVLANFTTLFQEFVESGSLGFKDNINLTKSSNSTNETVPVQVVMAPMEVHLHGDVIATTPKQENSTIKRVRHGDCLEGYRKDKKGVCRPMIRRPTQPSLLKKLLQISRRLQSNKESSLSPHSKILQQE